MKILFIIPTFFSRPEIALYTIRALESTIRKGKDRIVVVQDIRFRTDTPPLHVENNIHFDFVSNKPLGFTINKAVSWNRTDEDIICWIHDDMIIQDKDWIPKYLHHMLKPECGLIGIRTHTAAKLQKITNTLSEVTWTDGIMMCRYDVFKEMGGLDEEYLADCESQDFCFRLREKGYKIYRLLIEAKHKNQNFFDRRKDEDFWENVRLSRERFWKRWENVPGYDHMGFGIKIPKECIPKKVGRKNDRAE